jgi:hypothetical protein
VLKALKTALLTIVICGFVLLVVVSIMSTNQAKRARQRQEALREFARRNAEDAPAHQAGVASSEDRAKQAQRDLETDNAIANLSSSDRDVLNESIQKIQSRRACQAVPTLLVLLKESKDDYIAGIAAQTMTVCQDTSTYKTIVDQFLNRKPELPMIFAVGETGTSDERVFQKLDQLISEPNPEDVDVARFARHAKEQLEIQAPRRSH